MSTLPCCFRVQAMSFDVNEDDPSMPDHQSREKKKRGKEKGKSRGGKTVRSSA